jgi:hypothetical protein
MRFLLLLALLQISPIQAQNSASGRTTISGTFDPRNPPAPLPQPAEGPRRDNSTLSPAEYAARQQTLTQRRPNYIGPPMVELSDLTGGRAPVIAPRDPVALSATQSFEGILQPVPPQSFLVPPSPDIAAGPEELLMTVHSMVARFTKTGQQTHLVSLQQWFSSILPTICPSGASNCNMFDPSIKYDSLHGRFLILVFAEDRQTLKSHFALSVSNGATYDSGWKNWALEGNLNGTTPTFFEIDFPHMGYDNNAVYLTANMYDGFAIFRYSKLRILKKSELYNPATQTLTYRDLWDMRNEDNTAVSTLRPVQQRGVPGTGTPPGILVNASNSGAANYLTLWRVQDPTGNAPTLSRTTLSGVWPYDLPALFRGLGIFPFLRAGDTAILRAVVRNGVLYTARNSGYVGTPTTVTYDRIDLATNKVTLQARHVGGTFFYPAYDIPASLGPGNTLPTKLITGSSTDANGNLTYIGIPEVKAGEDTYLPPDTEGRWGDYFGGTIDPVSGGLWVFGEYAKTRVSAVGRWGTWTAFFPWSTSPQFTDVATSSPFYDFVNVMKLWSITTGCAADRYCPQDRVSRAQMAVFVVRAAVGENFTFPAAPFFTDVPSSSPFFKYVQKLKELGITEGCGATTFCPDANVTRAEMATFVVRGKLRSLHGDNFTAPATAFYTDVPTANVFFKFVQKLRELGITSGCTATTFCPNEPVTREQMGAFVARAFLN